MTDFPWRPARPVDPSYFRVFSDQVDRVVVRRERGQFIEWLVAKYGPGPASALLFGAMLCFLAFAVGLPMLLISREEDNIKRTMDLYGRPAVGVVRKAYTVPGKFDNEDVIVYSYNIGDGKMRWGRRVVDSGLYVKIVSGTSQIAIGYDCRNPNVSSVNEGNRFHLDAAKSCPRSGR